MKIRETIPNTLTLVNFACGFLALMSISQQRFEEAVWYVALGLVFDAIDGNVARVFHVTSEVGKELDSLGDLVSFVLVPGFYLAFAIPGGQSGWKLLVIFIFLICGVMRLAIFNVTTQPVRVGFFKGLPTPASAVWVLTTASGLESMGWMRHRMVPVVFFIFLCLVAYLMISPVTYPKLTVARVKDWWIIPTLAGPLLFFGYFYFNPAVGVSMAFTTYLVVGLLMFLVSQLAGLANSEQPNVELQHGH